VITAWVEAAMLTNECGTKIEGLEFNYHQRAKSKQQFKDLLSLTQNSLASNARDRIYAVLGLALEAFSLDDVLIDYSKPVLEAYHGVVKFHAKRNFVAKAAQYSQVLHISVPTLIQPCFETH
jgi:hypothetical protein